MKKQIRLIGKEEFIENNKKFIDDNFYYDENDGEYYLGKLPSADKFYDISSDIDVEQILDEDGDIDLNRRKFIADNIEKDFLNDIETFYDITKFLPKEFFNIIEVKDKINKLDMLKKAAIGTGILFMPGGLIVAGGYLLYKKLRG